MTSIVRRKAARKQLGISRTTEHRRLKDDPAFPPLRKISPGLTGYFDTDLERYILARPIARRTVPQVKRLSRRPAETAEVE